MLIEALPLVNVLRSEIYPKVEAKGTSAAKIFLPDFSSIEVIIPLHLLISAVTTPVYYFFEKQKLI